MKVVRYANGKHVLHVVNIQAIEHFLCTQPLSQIGDNPIDVCQSELKG